MKIQEETIDFNGKTLVLRNAKMEDAELLIEYLKSISRETRFLVSEPEEITLSLEDEINFIESQNDSEQNFMMVAFLDGEHVGNCSFNASSRKRYQHRASMGIALYQKFTGMGIGKIMIEKLISVAKDQGFEQLELEVNASNEKAIALYKKMGFEIYGTFPQNMKYKDGSYDDAYWMMKNLMLMRY